jgi:hypothetical protein
MSRHHHKPQTMSRDAAGWQLRRVLGSVCAVIVMCGTVTLFAAGPAIDSAHAAGSAPGVTVTPAPLGVTVTPAENNWG